MSKEFTLTKEEFITKSMAGEVFIRVSGGRRYFYDETEVNPFRLSGTPMSDAWQHMDGKTLFTLEEVFTYPMWF